MSLKNCLVVLWVYILYVLGIWLFLSGYLLKRIVVHQNSTGVSNIRTYIDCKDITSLQSVYENIDESDDKSQLPHNLSNNDYLKRFDRAIIIVIDALRFDFVQRSTPKNSNENFYLNKMPVFQQMLDKNNGNSLLFRLTADPPTTTLQRIKGLTTGSLPTFIDVSLNFASSEITEDNLIRQMNAFNKRIVFMGDDTWQSLFPNTFHRSFSFPSFNVKDLDTVDSGIEQHLFVEMEKNDSDVIIAHFLGVDHCGHRYGPRHPEMSRKLKQMNKVILNVIEKLKNDTILVVLGDHGMTESGDHGGDSVPEVSTALFLYSRNKLTTKKFINSAPTVAQVDIVPTLSLLLGLPIPFSNLGKVVTPLFTLNFKGTCFDEETDAAIASAISSAENAMQIQRYLHAYIQMSNELTDIFVTKMKNQLQDLSQSWSKITNNITESKNILFSISEGYKSYMENVRNTCSQKWAIMGSLFYKCREEQSSCENSDIIVSLEKLHQDQSHKLFRLVTSLASEIIPFILFLGVMCYKYCAKSQTVSAVCVKYGTFFVCVLTSLRWWLNIVSPEIVNRILKGNEVVLTRAALLTSTIMFFIILIYPILTEKPWEVPSKEIYCGSFASLLFIVLQILYLVAGDALSPAVMLMNFSIILFAVLIQFSFDGSESEIWTDTIILSLLSRHWFYATAHQPTFTSIQWDAAFLLNHKEIHSYTLSGALVVINTFSAFIFHGLAVPGILIVRDSFYVTTHSMARLHMKYLLCFGIKLLGTVIASFVLRRHLMVWKIFSPKLIYEVIGVIVTMFSVSFSHYFIIKVTSLYHKLIRMNLNQMFTSKDQ
ncbi:GPI ethanolamine phosphate transferase 3 [Trichonephila inaurata madagascariensis]|uniref:GPI ethanolamine phosphate transferase 3, catalytic subunit n=1 Tax=Trichonephila inaurata madagascariensis TaxID=2747483 RepID=A0A8X6Y084_9ARAC|nr:GPI ethanolamine phosphate transferase 3 [Trichonephila inaurata madagascariensis]